MGIIKKYRLKRRVVSFVLFVSGWALYTTNALAQNKKDAPDPDDQTLEEVVVYGRALEQIGTAQTASQGLVGYTDIALPPLLRVGELVEAVPGMVATQHSGTGKANQYFLRGFNLDHGTDFSVHVDGVPVNLGSHGHGQGYLDLNFIIPELVETSLYRKGPYHAGKGDFSSAGSVDFTLYRRLPQSVLEATVGEHGYRRVMGAGQLLSDNGAWIGAFDATAYDGPWTLDENLEQYKLYLSYTPQVDWGTVRVALQAYDSGWDATDQIPLRAVRSGFIDRFGFIDPDLGGDTSRIALSADLATESWRIGGYWIDYDFTLYSDFTYYLDQPLIGDEFEQRDDRSVAGVWVAGDLNSQLGAYEVVYRWGGHVRFDDIDEVGLYGTASRTRGSSIRTDRVELLSFGAYGEMEVALTKRLRTTLGLRADYYDWKVAALRPANGGSGDDALISPKLNAAYRIGSNIEAYASWGQGFHSNDIRGATITVDSVSGDTVDPVEALVKSHGAELGLRFERGRTFNTTLVGFWLELDSELVYVGDAGVTEPNDGSRRVGLELNSFWQASEWLALNATYTRTDAQFKGGQGGGRQVPGAVEETFVTGANAIWSNGFGASIRLRYLGEAPLAEDASVRSDDSWLLNAGIAHHRGPIELRLDVFNLLNSDDADIAYFYVSRLPGEAAGGVEDIHFHPLEPRSVRLSLIYHWDS